MNIKNDNELVKNKVLETKIELVKKEIFDNDNKIIPEESNDKCTSKDRNEQCVSKDNDDEAKSLDDISSIILNDESKTLNTIPIKVLYYSLKKHRRNGLYIELFYYMLFLSMFIFMNLNIIDISSAYQQNAIIYDNFLDEEFPNANYKKTYFDIGNINEFWEWMDGPFYNGFFGSNIVMKYNYPVGGIFLRQSRIKKHKCSIIKNVDYCYDEYNKESRFKGNYLDIECKYDIYPELYGKDEFLKYYGKDGCITYLPFNSTIAFNRLKKMKENNWVDESTRAISIYFNLYNSNTRLLTNGRFLVEFFNSGYEQPSYRIISMPFYPNKNNTALYVVGIIFSIQLIYYIYCEFSEAREEKNCLKYLLSSWNIVECINLFLFVSVIGIFLYWKYNINKKDYLDNLLNKSDSFDHYYYSYLFYQISILSATCCLIGFIKIFKYLRLNRRMKILWDTLSGAFLDLFYMLIVSLLIVSGFALTGNLIFGQTIREYKTFSSSMSTLLRSLLGDFDYKKMANTCPNIAPIYFVLYIFIVFFVITNMFIAVVCEYFQKIKDSLEEEERQKKYVIVTNFKENLYIYLFHESIFSLCCCCFKKKSDIDTQIRRRRFSITKRESFRDLWNDSEREKNTSKIFEHLFPNWRSMNDRYKISTLFNKIRVDEKYYNRFFKIFENNSEKDMELNELELNKITNNYEISKELINTYNKNLHNKCI